MVLSTSMEIGHILITLISLLLLGGVVSISCSLLFQPNAVASSVYIQKKKIIESKRSEVKQPIISDPIENYFDDEPAELEIDEDLFDD